MGSILAHFLAPTLEFATMLNGNMEPCKAPSLEFDSLNVEWALKEHSYMFSLDA